MRELNEQELEQVAGGALTFSYVAAEQAYGAIGVINGLASSKSLATSTHGIDTSSSFAANKSFAFGSFATVQSGASSVSSVTISG